MAWIGNLAKTRAVIDVFARGRGEGWAAGDDAAFDECIEFVPILAQLSRHLSALTKQNLARAAHPWRAVHRLFITLGSNETHRARANIFAVVQFYRKRSWSVTNSRNDKLRTRTFARGLCRVATAAVLAAGVMAPTIEPASAAAATYPQIFGSSELHSDNLTRFTKWTSVIRRSDKELARCQATNCDDNGWGEFLASVRQRGVVDQLRAVNNWANRVTYISDEDNRDTSDYWATPFEFLSEGGDCEDYAIAKYMALRELGVPADSMRLVVLQHLRRGIPHAVLVVYADGRPYVLDNLLPAVQLADNSLPYRPVYSVNETGWWLHVSPKTNKPNWTQTAAAPSATEAGVTPEERRSNTK